MRESLALIWDHASRCMHSILLAWVAAIVIGVALSSGGPNAVHTVDMHTHFGGSAVESVRTTGGNK